MAHDVFISYASSDKAVADAVCSQLESVHRIRCWIAPRDIMPGASWAGSIIDALDSSKSMVLIFSTHANASVQIEREVERAVHKGIIIIPLRIENAVPNKTLEYFISAPHWLDAMSDPLEQHIARLAASVKALMARPNHGAAAAVVEPEPPPIAPRAVSLPAIVQDVSDEAPSGGSAAPVSAKPLLVEAILRAAAQAPALEPVQPPAPPVPASIPAPAAPFASSTPPPEPTPPLARSSAIREALPIVPVPVVPVGASAPVAVLEPKPAEPDTPAPAAGSATTAAAAAATTIATADAATTTATADAATTTATADAATTTADRMAHPQPAVGAGEPRRASSEKPPWLVPAAVAASLIAFGVVIGLRYWSSPAPEQIETTAAGPVENETNPAQPAPSPTPAARAETAPAPTPAPPVAAATPAPSPSAPTTAAAGDGRAGSGRATPPVTEPNLFVDFRNSLSEGSVIVDIDGQTRWSQALGTALKGNALSAVKLRRSSEALTTSISVPTGPHKLTVTIVGPDGTAKERESIDLKVQGMDPQTLQIRLSRFKNDIQLSLVTGKPAADK